MRPSREFSLGFGAIDFSLWHCSQLLPEVSSVFDRTEANLGDISPTYASLPHVFLEMRPPRDFSRGFGAIEVSLWRCSKLLPKISPVFDRTEAVLGEISPTYTSLPEVSLAMRPPVSYLADSVPSRSLFAAIANYYRRPLQFSIVQKLFLGRYLAHTPAFQRFFWECVLPVSSLSSSVPPRSLFGTVANYYRRFLQYSIVQKLFLGRCLSHKPAFQRSLWKYAPLVSSLSGSVPPVFLFGAVANYYRRSLQYSIVQKLFLERSLPHTPAFQRPFWKCIPPVRSLSGSVPSKSLWCCSQLLPEVSPVFDRTEASLGEISSTYASLPEFSLEMRPLREFSLGYGAIEVSLWGCSHLLPEVSPVFDCTEVVLGGISPTYTSISEVSLDMRPPREFSLGFGAIEISLWRCSKLLPEVSPVFDRTEAVLGGISPTYASPPEVSLEMRPPREFSLGSVAIKIYFCRCTNLLPEVSPVFFAKAIVGTVSTPYATPHEFSRGFVITESSLRLVVDCCLCNSFDAHAGWVRDRRGARSLNLLLCRLPIFYSDKQLDAWDVWAKTWG